MGEGQDADADEDEKGGREALEAFCWAFAWPIRGKGGSELSLDGCE